MSITLRHMTLDDIPLGMRLKTQAGWNQTAADWQRFLRLEPDGCFVGQWQGQSVAITTTLVFDSVAWIAMVLVDSEFRHRGIASHLVEHALSYLKRRSVSIVRLDATRFGQPVYQRLGFVNDYELIRFAGRASEGAADDVAELGMDGLRSLQQLDRRATGTERARLLAYLADEHRDLVRLETIDDIAAGYAMLRPGDHAVQIGPVVALNQPTGQRLLGWACRQVSGQSIILDIPKQNHEAIQWAHAQKLREQRRFMRMHLGHPVCDRPDILWASSGPESG